MNDDAVWLEETAEALRREPYNLLTNDCFTKSLRLKRACRVRGIPLRVVVCIGTARGKWFGRWLTIPVLHGWGGAGRTAHRTSRPIGEAGMWSVVPATVRPRLAIRL